jgi:hypothetical protein
MCIEQKIQNLQAKKSNRKLKQIESLQISLNETNTKLKKLDGAITALIKDPSAAS